MADTKITDLGAIASVALADVFPLVDDVPGTPVTKKATVTQLRAALMPIVLGSDINGFAANIAAWLAAPSSANLLAALTDKTGTGLNLFGTAPTVKTSLSLRNPGDTFSYIFTPDAIAADRIVNMPLMTGTDTLALLAFAQALTNKTIVAANNTITDTGAALGDILRFNGTRFVRLARGADNEVLTSTATDVEWAAVPGGGAGSVGAAGQVQTSDGAAAFDDPTNVFAGANFISVGYAASAVATTGHYRLGGTGLKPQLVWSADGITDYKIISTDDGGNGTIFGDVLLPTNVYGTIVTTYATGTLYFYADSAQVMTMTSTVISILSPKVDYKGHARKQDYTEWTSVLTADATPAVVHSFVPTDNCITMYDVVVQAIKSDCAIGANYVRSLRIRKDGGVVTIGTVDAVRDDPEAGFAACVVDVIDNAGTIEVSVEGLAGTDIRWGATSTRYELTYS